MKDLYAWTDNYRVIIVVKAVKRNVLQLHKADRTSVFSSRHGTEWTQIEISHFATLTC